MSRLRAALSVIIAASVLAAVLSIAPQAADAHTSLVAETSVVVSASAEPSEAHCHKAVECVVTFYLEPLRSRTASGVKPELPSLASNERYTGWPLMGDPPIPIILV